MVLRGATSLRGELEGVGPENQDFVGPWNGTREYKRHKNNWYIGSFMYPSAVVVCERGGEVSLQLRLSRHRNNELSRNYDYRDIVITNFRVTTTIATS